MNFTLKTSSNKLCGCRSSDFIVNFEHIFYLFLLQLFYRIALLIIFQNLQERTLFGVTFPIKLYFLQSTNLLSKSLCHACYLVKCPIFWEKLRLRAPLDGCLFATFTFRNISGLLNMHSHIF